MRFRGIAVVLACASACTATTHRPDPVYARIEAELPAALEALGRLRDSIRAAGDDCAQIARSLRTFASAHHTQLHELGALVERLDAQEREKLAYEHHDDRVQLAELFQLTSTSCRGDKDVDAAVELAGFRDRLFLD